MKAFTRGGNHEKQRETWDKPLQEAGIAKTARNWGE